MNVKDAPLTGEYSNDREMPSMDDWKHSQDVNEFYRELQERGYDNELDAIRDELGEDLSDEELEKLLNEGQLDEGSDEYTEDSEDDQDDGEDYEDEGEESSGAFKPINFETEIDGKDYSLSINSEQDLNDALEKAALAEDLWDKRNELEEELEELREYSDFGRQHMERLEKDPMKLATDILEDQLFGNMGPQQFMQWAAQAYHVAKGYAEDPSSYHAAKTHHSRKGEEDPRLKEEREALKREREEFKIQQETAKLESWQTSVKSKYRDVAEAIGKISGDNKWLDNMIKTVTRLGMAQVREGKNFSSRDLERELQKLIAPTYNYYKKTSSNPKNSKKNPKNKKPTKSMRSRNKSKQDIDLEAIYKMARDSAYN